MKFDIEKLFETTKRPTTDDSRGGRIMKSRLVLMRGGYTIQCKTFNHSALYMLQWIKSFWERTTYKNTILESGVNQSPSDNSLYWICPVGYDVCVKIYEVEDN